MLSMGKEHSYNSVIATIKHKDSVVNNLERKIGRCDRGNTQTVQQPKAWCVDGTMKMR